MKSAIDKEYEGSPLTADEDRMIILGNEILLLPEVAPEAELSEQVLAHLDAFLDNPNERALFNLSQGN